MKLHAIITAQVYFNGCNQYINHNHNNNGGLCLNMIASDNCIYFCDM